MSNRIRLALSLFDVGIDAGSDRCCQASTGGAWRAAPPPQPGGGRRKETGTAVCVLWRGFLGPSPGQPPRRANGGKLRRTPTPRRALVLSAALCPCPHPCRSAAPFWPFAFTSHRACALRVVVGGVPRGQMWQLCNARRMRRLVGGGVLPSRGPCVCRSRGHPVADRGRTTPRPACCACRLYPRCLAACRHFATCA